MGRCRFPTNYRGYDVFELPPNGQGIATLQILNILEGFDLRAMGRNSPETLHTMIEAKKIAWADRAKFYADPAFAKIPLAGLLSKQVTQPSDAKLIDPNRAAKTVGAGKSKCGARVQGGDTYWIRATRFISAPPIAKATWFRLIQSNYRGMGSGIVVPGLGFMFQDRGELFSMEPEPRERLRARQTSISHHHSRVRDERRQTVGSVRRHGRRHATAGSRPSADQPDRFRLERAGSRRRIALATRRRQRTDRRKDDGVRRIRRSRKRHSVRNRPRVAKSAVTTCASTSAATAVIKPSKWKCTMASAFTSARANHAKTARLQATDLASKSG